MSVDDIITKVTEAPSTAHAFDVINAVKSRATLDAIADQLYVEFEGHSARTLRSLIVKEARS